jgi:cytochrome c peroxidase
VQKSFLFVVLVVLAVTLAGCGRPAATAVEIDPAQLKAFRPVPDVVPPPQGTLTAEKIALGRMLYYEPRLSRNHKISCNSCHDLAKYGVDGEPTSEGFKGQRGDRNSPTTYHAAAHFVQFWDGRAKDVEEQAKGPVLNPVEMAMKSDKEVVATLKSIPEYVEAFKRAFPDEKDPVTYDNLGLAIGAFERRLITPSRWDKFLEGDQTALSANEKAGFHAYTNAGCQACHSGTYLGGAMFQKVGVMRPWPDASDPGRYKVTKSAADQMVFKVPSLRNIEKTAPYFHDGKTATLADAIAKMADHQLGRAMPEVEVKAIEAFLKSLTGEIPVDYIKAPELPKSTDKTPKPREAD